MASPSTAKSEAPETVAVATPASSALRTTRTRVRAGTAGSGVLPSPGRITLIELLIVVAIIAILAAIAVPNFLEAQTRSKVSRVLADMRSMKTAMEAYFVDNNTYPGFFEAPSPGFNSDSGGYGPSAGMVLSSPISYMTNTQIIDPFMPPQSSSSSKKYIVIYSANRETNLPRADSSRTPMARLYPKNCYGFTSYGPDKLDNTQMNGWPFKVTSPLSDWAPFTIPATAPSAMATLWWATPGSPTFGSIRPRATRTSPAIGSKPASMLSRID